MKKLLSLALLGSALIFGSASTTQVQAATTTTTTTKVETVAVVVVPDDTYVVQFTAETATSLKQRVNTGRMNEAEYISLIRQHKFQQQVADDTEKEIKAKAKQPKASTTRTQRKEQQDKARLEKWVRADRQKDLPSVPGYKEDRN